MAEPSVGPVILNLHRHYSEIGGLYIGIVSYAKESSVSDLLDGILGSFCCGMFAYFSYVISDCVTSYDLKKMPRNSVLQNATETQAQWKLMDRNMMDSLSGETNDYTGKFGIIRKHGGRWREWKV